ASDIRRTVGELATVSGKPSVARPAPRTGTPARAARRQVAAEQRGKGRAAPERSDGEREKPSVARPAEHTAHLAGLCNVTWRPSSEGRARAAPERSDGEREKPSVGEARTAHGDAGSRGATSRGGRAAREGPERPRSEATVSGRTRQDRRMVSYAIGVPTVGAFADLPFIVELAAAS